MADHASRLQRAQADELWQKKIENLVSNFLLMPNWAIKMVDVENGGNGWSFPDRQSNRDTGLKRTPAACRLKW